MLYLCVLYMYMYARGIKSEGCVQAVWLKERPCSCVEPFAVPGQLQKVTGSWDDLCGGLKAMLCMLL